MDEKGVNTGVRVLFDSLLTPASFIQDAKNAVSADEVKIAGFDRKVDV